MTNDGKNMKNRDAILFMAFHKKRGKIPLNTTLEDFIKNFSMVSGEPKTQT